MEPRLKPLISSLFYSLTPAKLRTAYTCIDYTHSKVSGYTLLMVMHAKRVWTACSSIPPGVETRNQSVTTLSS